MSNAAALKLVAAMPQTTSMIIRSALVGDRFVEGLAPCDQLRYIEWKGINLTDDGLRHVLRLTNVRELLLEDVDITDKGVQYLAELKNLKRLTLRDVRISDDGFRQLHTAFPNCQISH